MEELKELFTEEEWGTIERLVRDPDWDVSGSHDAWRLLKRILELADRVVP